MPVYLLAALCAVAVVLLAGRLARRMRLGDEDAAADGPTNAHAGSMLSALFLAAFAIAIVVPWTTTDAARLNTFAESQAIVEATWTTTRLPAAEGAPLRDALTGYARFVRDREWPRMHDGRMNPAGDTALDDLRRRAIALPTDKGDEQSDARTALLDQIAQISTARHQRGMDARSSPPGWLLVITIATGLVVVLLPFLSGARPRGWTLVPLGIMAGLLGVGVWLAIDISHVFAGALAVKPTAFTAALAEIARIGAGG
ncbi:hypothetical protein [Actinomadura rayongensis]|uniref:DUF4239 domain-containing protein n=1 Tax=Actinomadura rayongensis TaxID=1429076 RepID=A0A6I4WG67_9ACTN|nr:hypothetical protein [Actinomadura rayongensis]MXQ67315.1 hypothetical protein [Actinomadura rayongensis]